MPNIRTQPYDFEPAIFNDAELVFLLDHMEEPPVVAFNKGVPAGVNIKTVQTMLNTLFNLEQLRLHQGQEWAGFGLVKASIERYLQWQERCKEIKRRSGGRLAHPSMFSYDGAGGFVKYGIESDSGFVKSEIQPDGSRLPFTVKLLEEGGQLANLLGEVAPWIGGSLTGKPVVFNDELKVERKGRYGKFECSICGKAEEFSTASKQAEGLARSRMARHLKIARQDVGRHRALYRKKFGAPDVKI